MATSNIVKVPVPKAGTEAFVEIDTAAITSDEVYAAIFMEGLKVYVNARMSKIGAVTKKTGADLEDAHRRAMVIANENKDKLLAGEIKAKGKKSAASAEDRKVMTEALRNAKEVTKNLMREQKISISRTPASEITAFAKKLVESDPSYIEKAREAIAAREAETEVKKSSLDFGNFVKEDPKLVAKAEKAKAEKKAEKDSQLSAKQAGLAKPRQRPAPATHAVH
jgi:hypothetical protein